MNAFRAKDEIRTRDPDLGKVVLYQLSYFRILVNVIQRLLFNRLLAVSRLGLQI